MVAVETASYLLGALGLLAGVGVVAALLRTDRAEAGAFRYLLIIPAFAALSYVAMAADLGTVVVAGYAFPVPRYVDWLVTTPILVGYVGYVAGAARRWVLGAAAVDATMILLGLGANLVTGPARWGLFGVSSLCYLGLLGTLYLVFPRAAAERSEDRRQLFEILQNHVGLLWVAYPVAWLVGPAGLGLVSGLALVLVITYLDVVAKTPYVYFVWQNRRAFDADDAGQQATGTGPTGPGEPPATAD
jgi:sensory rhodopsin